MNATNYEWVWKICSVRTNAGETVPMRKGDLLYVCIGDDGKAKFHHRGAGSDNNSGLWSKAVGSICEKGLVTGNLPDGTTFSMSIAQEEGYRRLTCKHQRNPEQGEWDADDTWGN